MAIITRTMRQIASMAGRHQTRNFVGLEGIAIRGLLENSPKSVSYSLDRGNFGMRSFSTSIRLLKMFGETENEKGIPTTDKGTKSTKIKEEALDDAANLVYGEDQATSIKKEILDEAANLVLGEDQKGKQKTGVEPEYNAKENGNSTSPHNRPRTTLLRDFVAVTTLIANGPKVVETVKKGMTFLKKLFNGSDEEEEDEEDD